MNLTLEATETNDLQVARYSGSTATHFYYVSEISGEYKKELDDWLREENTGNGDFKVFSYDNKIINITYETTDSYEFSDWFAEEMADIVAEAVIAVARGNGGNKTASN